MRSTTAVASPAQGLLAPNAFISLAEDTGLIVPIGKWVLNEASRQCRTWQGQFPSDSPLTVSVNLSPKQFEHEGIVDSIALSLQTNKLPAETMTLEITESLLMKDTEKTTARLRELRSLGTRLAIDDFGTAYSSLAYLRRFPIDDLKIDKQFVDGILKGAEESALCRGVITLAESLGMKTVAEGIESSDQAEKLVDLGCILGQGYYFSRPLEARDVTSLLTRSGAARTIPLTVTALT
jgi:EAL domain-containing protein (putative c-di-GMP-specific phosphodiesterase class I)